MSDIISITFVGENFIKRQKEILVKPNNKLMLTKIIEKEFTKNNTSIKETIIIYE